MQLDDPCELTPEDVGRIGSKYGVDMHKEQLEGLQKVYGQYLETIIPTGDNQLRWVFVGGERAGVLEGGRYMGGGGGEGNGSSIPTGDTQLHWGGGGACGGWVEQGAHGSVGSTGTRTCLHLLVLLLLLLHMYACTCCSSCSCSRSC
jgi:hypothetical protein